MLGGSSAEGLGVKGRSFADLLPARLNNRAVVSNLAHTANQISDSLLLLDKIDAFDPHLIVAQHGVSEAVVRPSDKALKLVFPRWRMKGWLDPRPYFSRRWYRCWFQQAESALRWRYKSWLIRRVGATQWTNEADFADQLRHFLTLMLAHPNRRVVLLTNVGIDGRFFPGSPEAFERYRAVTLRVADEFKDSRRVMVCDLYGRLQRWSHYFADHFHPNHVGHEIIATAVADSIRALDAQSPPAAH